MNRPQPLFLLLFAPFCALSLASSALRAEASERPIYRCGSSYQNAPCADGNSQPLQIDPPPSTPVTIRPLPDLAPALPAKATPTPAPLAEQPPYPCNPPSAEQQAQIARATRFWRVVPCMSAKEALRIIGDAPMAMFDLSDASGEMFIELVIEPQPRLPNRVFIRRGYVVETSGGGQLP